MSKKKEGAAVMEPQAAFAPPLGMTTTQGSLKVVGAGFDKLWEVLCRCPDLPDLFLPRDNISAPSAEAAIARYRDRHELRRPNLVFDVREI